MGEAGLGAEQEPCGECEGRDGKDGGNKPGGDLVGKGLNGCAAALGFGDEGDDAGEDGFGADLAGAHHKSTRGVDGASGDEVADVFFGRHGFAGEHGFVDRSDAFEKDSIDGNFFAGSDAQ